MRNVVNETSPPFDEYCLSRAASSAAERGWPSTESARGPVVTSVRPSWPSNVHSPITEVGGIPLILSVGAATTLASRVLPPSSLGIDWSSMMVAATPDDDGVMALASVARIPSSPTDSVDGSAGKLVTALLGGLTPLTRKPAFASLASCSG